MTPAPPRRRNVVAGFAADIAGTIDHYWNALFDATWHWAPGAATLFLVVVIGTVLLWWGLHHE